MSDINTGLPSTKSESSHKSGRQPTNLHTSVAETTENRKRKSPVKAERRAKQRKVSPPPKKERFRRCRGQRKLQCPSCSLNDCMTCKNCRNRSSGHQACLLKPKQTCVTYIQVKAKGQKSTTASIKKTIRNPGATTTTRPSSAPELPKIPPEPTITSQTVETNVISTKPVSTTSSLNPGAINIGQVQQELNSILSTLSSSLATAQSQVNSLKSRLNSRLASTRMTTPNTLPYPHSKPTKKKINRETSVPESGKKVSSTTSPTSNISKEINMREKMKQALSKIRINLYITKCGISGPPSTGKTHFRALLLGKKRPKQQQSTSLSTRAYEVATGGDIVSTVQRKSGAFKWTVLEKEPWVRLLANTVYENIFKDFELEADYNLNADTDCSDPTDLCELVYSHLCTIIAEEAKKTKNKKRRTRRTLRNIHLLYLVDTGGQPQFQEILPNFVRSSINFLVHNLTQSLADCPAFEYCINGSHYTVPKPLRMTNISIIEETVRSVCSTSRTEAWDKPYPAAAIVGMFKDKCNTEALQDMLRKKSKDIKSKLQPHTKAKPPRKCDIIEYSRDQCIFPIDASVAEWGSNGDTLDKLMVEVNQYGKKNRVKIPISYFFLLQKLKNFSKEKKMPYIFKNEYMKIARDSFISLNDDEIQQALCLFNDVNIILHFSKSANLQNLIFVDPSFLYDRVSDIIVQSFDSSDSITQGSRFYRSGIFTYDLLLSIPRLQMMNDSKFTLGQFLSILEDLCIISKVEGRSYFMPCVLPLEDLNSISQECGEQLEDIKMRMFNNNVEGPLVISFGDETSPRGLFCAIVVVLSKKFGWRLSRDSTCIRQRNIIEFSVYSNDEESSDGVLSQSSIGTAVIFDKTKYVEVYTTCPKEHCSYVRNAIILSLDEACSSMKYRIANIAMEVGFYCEFCPRESSSHHTIVSRNSKKELSQKCSKNTRKHRVPLGSQHSVWFHDNHRGASNEVAIPTLTILLNEVVPRTNKWKIIGHNLELSLTDLERTNIDCPDEKSRFEDVLAKWQKSENLPFTWNTIIEVLNGPLVQENVLARELMDKYIS